MFGQNQTKNTSCHVISLNNTVYFPLKTELCEIKFISYQFTVCLNNFISWQQGKTQINKTKQQNNESSYDFEYVWNKLRENPYGKITIFK